MGSESRYEALLEVLHPAIWTVAADGRVTAVSVGAEDLSGWPAAAARGRPWAQVAETLELTCREPFSFAAPPAEWPPIVRQECEITTSAGARRFVSLSCRVLDGKSAPALVVMEDLTPGYRAAQSLDDSERRYGALFETLVAGVLVASEDGQVVDCNAAVCAMLGAGREEVLAHKLGDFVPPEVGRQVPDLDNPDLQGEGYSFECHARRLNGESLPVEVHLRTVRFGGELLAVAHVRDVTLRHAAEAALRESKDTAWAMLNATHDYAMLLSADGTVLGANEAMARSLGVPLADLLGRNAYGCMAPAVALARRRHHDETIDGGVPLHFEDERDGRHFYSAMYPIAGLQGRPPKIAVFAREVTQQKQAEQAQRLATVGQLAAGVAHEFNNLLAGLMLGAETAAYQRDLGEYERLTELVLRSCSRGAEICRNLMAFAKPRTPRRQPMYVEEAIEGALTLTARPLEASGITVQRDYHSAGKRLDGDPGQLEQVFINLIMNACHAMQAGGSLRLATTFVPGAGPEDRGSVQVVVSDTGTGISEDHLPHIFEPFFTTKGRLGQSELPGTGLGLSVSHGIVKSHGGSIIAQSLPGDGASFTLRFPACLATEPQVVAAPADQFRVAAPPPPGKRVLLADDEADVRHALTQMLVFENYRVTAVASATEAISVLQREPFAVVITDLLMPGGGGAAVIAHLEEQEAPPPVLVITGHLEELASAVQSSRLQLQRLLKPFTREQLRTALAELLGSDE